MNFVKNGSFESGQFEPWVVDLGDPDKIVISENHAVLLPVGTQIYQYIDLSALGSYRTFIYKVSARASLVASAEPRKVKCGLRFGMRYKQGNNFIGTMRPYYATGGMQHFLERITVPDPESMDFLEIKCWVVPNLDGPDVDLRDIWFTGFELVPE